MKTINKIAFSKLSNAYHVSFLFAINQLIKEFKQKAYSNGTAEDDEEEDNEDVNVNVNENSSENAVNAEKENVSVNAD